MQECSQIMPDAEASFLGALSRFVRVLTALDTPPMKVLAEELNRVAWVTGRGVEPRFFSDYLSVMEIGYVATNIQCMTQAQKLILVPQASRALRSNIVLRACINTLYAGLSEASKNVISVPDRQRAHDALDETRRLLQYLVLVLIGYTVDLGYDRP